MPHFVLLLTAVLLLSLIPCPVVLGQHAAVSVGQRVRVEWSDAERRHRTVGTVLELQSDSLALTESSGTRTFALAGLGVDVRVPRSRPRGAARGAGLGALVGLAAGLVAGGGLVSQCGEGDEMCAFGFALLSAGGLIAGTVVGAVAGAAFPGRRWQRVRTGG